jgi:FemAB-related protein (PEP-CTERM system-associated)
MKALAHSAVTERAVIVRADRPPEACEAYVAAHPLAAAYHRPAWLDVIRSSFGRPVMCLVAESGDKVVGTLPLVLFSSRLFGRFAVSMPFLNYGGVLADDAGSERALLNHAIQVTREAGGSHLELRHRRQHFADLTPVRHKVAMTLHLESSPDRQWRALDRKVRNQVRKGEKSGLRAAHGGLDLVGDFYEVFARNMRDLGTPVCTVRFFHAVLSRFPETSRIFVVRAAGRPVAASVVHWHRNTIEVPWASALREYHSVCANVMLYWQMVRFAIDRGLGVFDFGRSTPGGGTFHFKKQWGAEPTPLVWEYWTAEGRSVPRLNPANPRFSLAIRAWQRLPVALATRIGPLIVRHIP